MKTMRQALRWGTFTLFLLANPAYFVACGAAEEDPDFGEAEMLAVLQEANEASAWTAGEYEVKVALDQASADAVAAASRALAPTAGGFTGSNLTPSPTNSAGFIRNAHACSQRSFVASAAACEDTTEMPITGTISVSTPSSDGTSQVVMTAPVEGSLMAFGLSLSDAILFVYFDTGSAEARWTEDEGFRLSSLSASDLGESGYTWYAEAGE